jgi:3'-5' exoribonuclease
MGECEKMSLPRIAVADLTSSDKVQSTFLVKYIAEAHGRDGKPYINLVLSDATGEIPSRIWSGLADLAQPIEKGQFVAVDGKMNLYQGKKQFIITHIKPIAQSELNLADFISTSKLDPDVMFQDLLKIIEGLDEYYIQKLLLSILHDPEIERRLKKWQAGKTIHHAYTAGLLEHILSCSRLALFLSQHYQANQSYVLAGCILHDLCKIYELTDGHTVDYTEEGKLVGHLVKGVELVERYAHKIADFPHDQKMHLKHILLSHHGELAYGSPKLPQTKEAYLVHLIDLMDSKMASVIEVMQKDTTPGHWSGFVKHLDRIIYKEELPSYSTPVEAEKSQKSNNSSGELKQSLGSLLKDVKL